MIYQYRSLASPCILILFLFLVIIIAQPCVSYEYAIKQYSNSDGLPQSQVLSVFPDNQGYLWIGTYCGAARYDGAHFRHFTVHEGLASNYVYDLDEDEHGNIYVAASSGICKISPLLKVNTILVSEGSETIRDITVLDNNSIIYLTESGYSVWNGYETKKLLNASRGEMFRRSLKYENIVYLPTERGLYTYSEGRLSDKPKNVEPMDIYTVTVMNDQIYVGTLDAVYRLHEGTAYKVIDIDMPRTLFNHDSSLWIGGNTGIYHSTFHRHSHISDKNGLSDSTVMSLGMDREGNIWIGTNSGLNKLGYRFIKCFYKKDGLPSNRLWCLVEDPVHGILMAGEGGISRYAEGIFKSFHLEGLQLDRLIIRSFVTARDGSSWIGTFRDGLVIHSKGKSTFLTDICGVPVRNVYSIIESDDGSMWLGTSNGVFQYSNDHFRHYGFSQGVLSETVWQIVQSPQKQIIIATDNGLAVFDNGHFNIPEYATELKNKTIRNITFDARNRMWVGTNGYGIYICDGKHMQCINRSTGFVDDFIWGIVFESDDISWIGTNRGIVRYTDNSVVVFDRKDGLAGDEMTLNALLKDSNDNLWFGVIPGLVMIDTKMFLENTLPPMIAISRVNTNGKTILNPQNLLVNHTEHEIIFYMDGLSFQDEHEVRFQYRLEGYDDWSRITSNRSVRYTNIPPGEYIFQVKACNNFGFWTKEPAAIEVIKKPAWFQTNLFKVMVAMAIILFMIFFIRNRLAASQREQLRLKQLVDQRTEELYQASITDPLLDIYNRRYIDDLVNKKIKEAIRHGDGMCLALLDLDHFKELNDKWGHMVGDAFLQFLASELQSLIRASDALARYGGDEFIIIFFRTDDGNQLRGRLQTIVDTIAQKIYEHNGISLSMTVSIGATWHRFSEKSAITYDHLLHHADDALYKAKSEGRNRFYLEILNGEEG